MRWQRGGRSSDLRDMRSSSGGGGGLGRGGGLGGMPIPRGKAGLVVMAVLVVMSLLGGGSVLGGGGGTGVELPSQFDRFPSGDPPSGSTGAGGVPGAPDAEEDLVQFVSFVLDDVQGHWTKSFKESGQTYARAELVLFRSQTDSGCGAASAASGPFYCPLDQTAYLDLSFFRELRERFGAPGDFAQAYVLAHEIGHHVQKVTGINDRVRRAQSEDRDQANELSIRQELQADCLAGVWGHSTFERGILESGDLEEGLAAAASVGDDRIQKQSSGRVNPETWTHGSAEQRTRWFRKGFDSGLAEDCDTFSGDV
jgi:predicted metalloprotease